MIRSRHRHRRRGRRRPLLGLGISGAAIAAAVIAIAAGLNQAAGGQSCSVALMAAERPALQQAGAVSGTATHYVLSGLPNCSYPSPPADGLFVAMPPGEYAAAAACGGYLEVHGPNGSVRVEVVDQCPDCEPGHIDLSEAAFSALAPLDRGLIGVTYQHLVNPPLPGSISMRVKEGSSRYWLALLVLNTGNPLSSVQVESGSGGGWQALARADYNYWVVQSGAGTGPFTVKLTDTVGHVVKVPGITLSPAIVQQTGTWMYGASGPAPASTPAQASTSASPQASVTPHTSGPAPSRPSAHPAKPAQDSAPPTMMPIRSSATQAATPAC